MMELKTYTSILLASNSIRSRSWSKKNSANNKKSKYSKIKFKNKHKIGQQRVVMKLICFDFLNLNCHTCVFLNSNGNNIDANLLIKENNE